MSSSWRSQVVSMPRSPSAASTAASYSNCRSSASSRIRWSTGPAAACRGVRPRRAGTGSSSQCFPSLPRAARRRGRTRVGRRARHDPAPDPRDFRGGCLGIAEPVQELVRLLQHGQRHLLARRRGLLPGRLRLPDCPGPLALPLALRQGRRSPFGGPSAVSCRLEPTATGGVLSPLWQAVSRRRRCLAGSGRPHRSRMLRPWLRRTAVPAQRRPAADHPGPYYHLQLLRLRPARVPVRPRPYDRLRRRQHHRPTRSCPTEEAIPHMFALFLLKQITQVARRIPVPR
jgi:hypothetical protein